MGKNPNGFVATAEIGSLLIKSKAGLRKELLKELMITLQHIWNSSSSSWSWLVLISSLVEHNWKNSLFFSRNSFQTRATTLQGPPLPPAVERQKEQEYHWNFHNFYVLLSPMLRGRVVTEKPLAGRRSRFARHSSPYCSIQYCIQYSVLSDTKNITGDRKMLKSLVGWCSKVAK